MNSLHCINLKQEVMKWPTFLQNEKCIWKVGYATNRAPMNGNLMEKAAPMVMIGYGENYSKDVYHVYKTVEGELRPEIFMPGKT